MRLSRALPCVLAALALAAPLAAQAPRVCPVVPDTVPGPTAGQIRERNDLRDDLIAAAREQGVAEPRGLLYVDVDSTRKGIVRLLDTNVPEEGVEPVVRRMETYLESLPAGRGYRALVRIDGEYPIVRGGRLHCPPEPANLDDLNEAIREIVGQHPRYGRVRFDNRRTAVVWLVVSRDGLPAFVHVTQPSDDAFYDRFLLELAEMLRFRPALLDGQPFDARFRLNLPFPAP